jgi:hypothetical protein
MEGMRDGREQVRHGHPTIQGADREDEEEIEQGRTIVPYVRAGWGPGGVPTGIGADGRILLAQQIWCP